MPLSEAEVLQVMELFQQSDWDELELKSGDLHLQLSRRERRAVSTTMAPASAPVPAPVPNPATAATAPASDPTPAAQEVIDRNWIAVRAPMLGTFFAAPSPGAAPFVTVGQTVSADDTVAIVEVMKLMNHVKAGSAGKIVRISARNGELVEFDEALIYLEPAA